MSTIRFISPSGAIEPNYVSQAQQRLSAWGHHVEIAPHALDQTGRFAGSDTHRLADIHNAMQDSQLDYLWCTRGGYGIQRIMDAIQGPFSNKGTIVGFSDITCLHSICALHAKPSLHAPMAKELGTLPETAPALSTTKKILEGEKIHYQLPSQPQARKGECEGILIGGNLSVLYGLQGTPYSLEQIIKKQRQAGNNILLFLEDIGEQQYHLDRMMHNLRLSGVLSQIKGVVFGHFTDCPDDSTMLGKVQDTLSDAVSGYTYPVVMGFPSGHEQPNLPLWLGVPYHIQVGETETILTQLSRYNNITST